MHVHINLAQLFINAVATLALLFFLNIVAMRFKDRSNIAASYANLVGVS